MHTHYNSSVKLNKSSDGGKCYERCVHFHASTNPRRLVWFGGMAVHKRLAAMLSHTAKTHHTQARRLSLRPSRPYMMHSISHGQLRHLNECINTQAAGQGSFSLVWICHLVMNEVDGWPARLRRTLTRYPAPVKRSSHVRTARAGFLWRKSPRARPPRFSLGCSSRCHHPWHTPSCLLLSPAGNYDSYYDSHLPLFLHLAHGK